MLVGGLIVRIIVQTGWVGKAKSGSLGKWSDGVVDWVEWWLGKHKRARQACLTFACSYSTAGEIEDEDEKEED